ncbi:PTS sugar transporter subunit IIA [Pelosinus propionicus]|uniref:PTS system, D-glucosaminate-specific IIA component n=1 Tax=Pelosinus propionicus DSM 13327 TaxID=1123291 RepID=A0A1I4GZ46_9FIRM|nr:PTS fructose transporter subunit IIA [Pelosinus propionicus]SFL35249.1 PTS system, D-glucosaminate-specific IIA component [Pelosinus propionicus DSM 13327]
MSDTSNELEEGIPGIVIVTHGKFGEELVKSAEMIMGPMESVKALSLMPGMEPADFMAEINKVLESMTEGSLLISDLFGGTPANVSAAISTTRNVSAVAGLSLGMVIEAVTARMGMRGEELAKAVIKAGRDGCQNILVEVQELDSL